jgi:hypothetical protein
LFEITMRSSGGVDDVDPLHGDLAEVLRFRRLAEGGGAQVTSASELTTT